MKHSLTWLSVVGRAQLFVNKDGNHNDNNQHYDGQARYQVYHQVNSKPVTSYKGITMRKLIRLNAIYQRIMMGISFWDPSVNIMNAK